MQSRVRRVDEVSPRTIVCERGTHSDDIILPRREIKPNTPEGVFGREVNLLSGGAGSGSHSVKPWLDVGQGLIERLTDLLTKSQHAVK